MQNLPSAIQLIFQGCENRHCHRLIIRNSLLSFKDFYHDLFLCNYFYFSLQCQDTNFHLCGFMDNLFKSTQHRPTLI